MIINPSFQSPGIFNLPYSLNVRTFQNLILIFHFMPKRSPLISGHLHFSSVSLIIVFKVCRLLAYSTWSQWWGCHLNLWAGWFSVRVSSPGLWRSPFSTRQWSTLGILFPQYLPYLVSLPLSATWGGARWETSNSTWVFTLWSAVKLSIWIHIACSCQDDLPLVFPYLLTVRSDSLYHWVYHLWCMVNNKQNIS